MRAKYEDIVTAVGTFKFANLNVARDYNNNGKFAYDAKFVLEGAEAQIVKDAIEVICMAELGKPHSGLTFPVYKDETDDDGSEYTVFSLKVKASIESKSGKTIDKKPKFLTTAGVPVSPEPIVGGGTRAAVCIRPYTWEKPFPGITLQPDAVMIHELVEYIPRDDAYYANKFATAGADQVNDNPAPRSAPAAGRAADF
jgi:hypothetical protein